MWIGIKSPQPLIIEISNFSTAIYKQEMLGIVEMWGLYH